MITLQSRPYMAIPAALCRRCGLRAGDRVLLVARSGENALAATAVDRAGAPLADGAERPEVQAALLVLERMGLSPADLIAVRVARLVMPTFAEYVPVVSEAVTAGTRRAYGSYWNRVVEHWGDRSLDEPNRQAQTAGFHSPGRPPQPPRRNKRDRCNDRQRSRTGHAPAPTAHRDGLPPRRRARSPPSRPGPQTSA